MRRSNLFLHHVDFFWHIRIFHANFSIKEDTKMLSNGYINHQLITFLTPPEGTRDNG